MGPDAKRSGASLPLLLPPLLLLCGWVAPSEGGGCPGIEVLFSNHTLAQSAKITMRDSKMLEEMIASAAKNQAGAKAIKGIKGLKMKKFEPPRIYVEFDPEQGLKMYVHTEVTIAGKSFIGGKMEIEIKSVMITVSVLRLDAKKYLVLEIKTCGVNLESCKTNLPSNMLPKIVGKFLNSTLVKVLPGMMCPAAEKVVVELQIKIELCFREDTIGSYGKIKYSTSDEPEVTRDYIGICLRGGIYHSNGELIEVAYDPAAREKLPPKKEGYTEIRVPVHFLNGIVKLFVKDLTCDVTSSKDPTVTASTLIQIVATLGGSLGPSQSIRVEIRLAEAPLFYLSKEESTLDFHYSVVFLADGEKALAVDMHQKVPAQFSMNDEKLEVSLETEPRLEGITLSVSHPAGASYDEAELKGFVGGMICRSCIPGFQATLMSGRMAVPQIMGLKYSECDTVIRTEQEFLVMDMRPHDVNMGDLKAKFADKF